MINYYVLDLETNGLNKDIHGICEVSIIRASDRMQFTRNVKVDKPEHSSIDALKIIKKSMNDLRSGMNNHDMIKEVEYFFSEDKAEPSHRCIVGHNVSFDRRFLWAAWNKYNRKFPADLYLDTATMFKDYCKKNGVKEKHNLTNACDYLGIKKIAEFHNARGDSRHTFLLWQELIKTVDFMDHIKMLPHILE